MAISGHVEQLNISTFEIAVAPGLERPTLPRQIGGIPARAMVFQHRDEMDHLRAAVDDGGTAVLSQVLTGMGGVGKTQLAAEYARTAWASGSLDLLIWITASDRSSIISEYARAGAALCHANPEFPEEAAQAFLAWLQPRQGSHTIRWLVVLDDISSPADIRGLWPPTCPDGRTMLTTRRRDAALTGRGHLVEVGLFREKEAVEYLTQFLAQHRRREPTTELVALAAALGFLPLALSQAAAYIVDTDLDCLSYRRLLAQRTSRLLHLLPDTESLPDDQQIPVATTWSLSLERAEALAPAALARPLLQVAAMLDPNGVPGAVLTSKPILAYLATYRIRLFSPYSESLRVSAPEVIRALRVLYRLSLVDHNSNDPLQTVRVHQLVQRTARDEMNPHQFDRCGRVVADALAAAWPASEIDAALGRVMRINTLALMRCAESAMFGSHAHPLLFLAGTSFGRSGQVTAARSYYKQLSGTSARQLGKGHPDTLALRHDLARWQGESGDAIGAVAAFKELLTEMLRTLGPMHPNVISARHSLARWRGDAGDAAAALMEFTALLDLQLQQAASSSPAHLPVRHRLAYWRGDVSALVDPAPEPEYPPGPDDMDLLATRHSIAYWRGRAGDSAGAAKAFADLLVDRLRILGPDHPDTLANRHSLAYWRGESGDPAGAATATAQLLADRIRVLGSDHPDTLTSRHSLARWRGDAGDAAGAAAAFTELLADRLRVLGADHPDTLASRHSLAEWRGRSGDVAGAVAGFTDLVDDRTRVLGPKHPHTLAARKALTAWQT
ncbi:tetratricopeptide repeat protein [Frankia sp. AgB32]|uniref:tetratricopeptide repeat protein n=1 Tax=Frankia sp. AgB32 TaxID=631119 RepID=UPI00200CA93F|nr:tetratricopeptide repeat protein [Frankia sp. AgB32]MCK9898182.1 tetratricopeptide repeat protein [Frankia sp. AgB32]